MGDPCDSGALIPGSRPAPDLDRYDGSSVIFQNKYLEAIFQMVFLDIQSKSTLGKYLGNTKN
jgi:hypothetical protein